MRLAETPTRFGAHQNAFGFLRLLFASLVIVSHVPEVIDGGPRREILSRLTGTITFGSFAVYGFFVISGYLITGSLLSSTGVTAYLLKRVARIYPAFILASLVCLVVVAPLSGAAFSGTPLHTAVSSLGRMAILARPVAEHPFAGQHYSDRESGLNGAMWTIQYEFACYLMVVGLGAAGLLKRRWPVPVLALGLLVLGTAAADRLPAWLSHTRLFPGPPDQLILLPAIFLAGASYRLYRHEIRFTPLLTGVAAVAFAAALFSWWTVWLGYAVFGSYCIFAVARAGAGTRVGRINDRTDISYGIYLYASPTIQLLVRYVGGQSLVLVGVLTWAIAALAGWLSWRLVEKPVLALVRDRQPATARPAAQAGAG